MIRATRRRFGGGCALFAFFAIIWLRSGEIFLAFQSPRGQQEEDVIWWQQEKCDFPAKSAHRTHVTWMLAIRVIFFLFDALVQVKWSDDEKDECLTREEAEKVNVNDDEGGWG